MSGNWQIRRLEATDHRDNFNCGEESINKYFKERALSSQNKNGSVTWVLVLHEKIVGFYTSAFSSLAKEEAPPAAAKATKPYAVPAFLIARLGVQLEFKTNGYGRKLVSHALLEALDCSKRAGLTLVTVDALKPEIMGFYEKFGFETYNELAMFTLIRDLELSKDHLETILHSN